MDKGDIVSLQYPMLIQSNYLAWSIKMVSMCTQEVWDAVEPKDPKVSTEEKDQMARCPKRRQPRRLGRPWRYCTSECVDSQDRILVVAHEGIGVAWPSSTRSGHSARSSRRLLLLRGFFPLLPASFSKLLRLLDDLVTLKPWRWKRLLDDRKHMRSV